MATRRASTRIQLRPHWISLAALTGSSWPLADEVSAAQRAGRHAGPGWRSGRAGCGGLLHCTSIRCPDARRHLDARAVPAQRSSSGCSIDAGRFNSPAALLERGPWRATATLWVLLGAFVFCSRDRSGRRWRQPDDPLPRATVTPPQPRAVRDSLVGRLLRSLNATAPYRWTFLRPLAQPPGCRAPRAAGLGPSAVIAST